MRLSLNRMVVLAGLSILAAFPGVAPGETHERRLLIAPEASCAISEALPARIASLPRFSHALLSARTVRIVAIGSSSTQGIGASGPTQTYPSQLRALLELALPRTSFEMVNLGIGGETADQTVARLRRDIPRLKPDLVIWQVGTNDGLTGVPVKVYDKTVRSALEFLKGDGDDTLLVGMQWTRKFAANANYMAVRDATTLLAKQEGVTLVSRFDSMRLLAAAHGREELIGPDHLHMNDRGYRCLAEQVAATLAHALVEDQTAEFGVNG